MQTCNPLPLLCETPIPPAPWTVPPQPGGGGVAGPGLGAPLPLKSTAQRKSNPGLRGRLQPPPTRAQGGWWHHHLVTVRPRVVALRPRRR